MKNDNLSVVNKVFPELVKEPGFVYAPYIPITKDKLMKKNCKICGIKLNDMKTYNPYNESFKHYMFKPESNEGLCKKCAEKAVIQENRYKGGHWVLEKEEEVKEAIKMYKCKNCKLDIQDNGNSLKDHLTTHYGECIHMGRDKFDDIADFTRERVLRYYEDIKDETEERKKYIEELKAWHQENDELNKNKVNDTNVIQVKVQKYRSSGKGVNEDFNMRRITIDCNSHDAHYILSSECLANCEISYE